MNKIEFPVEITHEDGGVEKMVVRAIDEDGAFEEANIRAYELCGGPAREIVVG